VLAAFWVFADQAQFALHWPTGLQLPRPSHDLGLALAVAVMLLLGLCLVVGLARHAATQRQRAAALVQAMASMSTTPKALQASPSPWPPLSLPQGDSTLAVLDRSAAPCTSPLAAVDTALPPPPSSLPLSSSPPSSFPPSSLPSTLPSLFAPDTSACEHQPRRLAEMGLAAALESEINLQTWPGQPSHAVLQVSTGSAPQRLPRALELAAFWIAREALCNALNPAHVSAVVVFLDIQKAGQQLGLRLEVHDIGHGVLGPSAATAAGGTVGPKTSWPRDLDQHPSVTTMRHRAQEVGARLTLRSEPQQGTRIILRWQA
jgi:hypothetical protein